MAAFSRRPRSKGHDDIEKYLTTTRLSQRSIHNCTSNCRKESSSIELHVNLLLCCILDA